MSIESLMIFACFFRSTYLTHGILVFFCVMKKLNIAYESRSSNQIILECPLIFQAFVVIFNLCPIEIICNKYTNKYDVII